jgi:YVTN family beta-propeller protein
MIVVDIIPQTSDIQVSTRSIVAGGSPAPGTVNVVDEDDNPLDSVTVASGATETVIITSSQITRSDDSVITELLAEQPYQVPDTEVVLTDTAGSPLSTTNVKADSTAEIEAPDGTATAQNSLGTPVGTVDVKSGGTGVILISDTQINRSNGSNIGSTPSGVPYAVAVSPVRVEYLNGTLVSNTDVLAATATTIQVPNPLTLQDNVNASTSAQIVTAITTAGKQCEVQSLLLDRYKSNGFASIGSFGTLTGSNGASMVHNGLIYITSLNNVQIYDSTSYALLTVVPGFNGAAELAISPDGTQYAVVNFSGNTVRIMDTATNTQIASFAVLTGPWTVCYNAAGTELYISAITSTTITRYNLSGTSLGTVPGFDGRILEVRRVGLNYHVLTATGTSNPSTQRVRVMDFATNTEQSSNALGTVTTIGTVQTITIEGSFAYLCALKGSGNSTTLFVYEYNLNYILQRGENTCINGTNLWGVAYNPANCGTLVLPCSQLATAINLIL